jgi:hypothetical protein
VPTERLRGSIIGGTRTQANTITAAASFRSSPVGVEWQQPTSEGDTWHERRY